MINLRDSVSKMIRAVATLLLLAISLPVMSADRGYLLLSDGSQLADQINRNLERFLVEIPNDIQRDSERGAFITEEGQEIKFNAIFHTKSLRNSKVIPSLVEEYAPDFFVLAWTTSKSSTDSFLNTSQKTIHVYLRVLDASGRNVYRGTESFKSKPSITVPEDEDIVFDLVAKYDFSRVEKAIAKNQNKKHKRGQPIKVVFSNISQTDYFEKRDGLIQLLESAGDISKVRDKHKKTKSTLTVRATLKGDMDEFYRNLYNSALLSKVFDNFALDREDNKFVFSSLPPTRKRLIVTGLTSQQYHDRLTAYQSAITSQEGVTDVLHEYLTSADQSGQTTDWLIFDFTYNGNLAALERQIWASLDAAGMTRNRQLTNISDQVIQYQSGSDQVLIAYFHNVVPTYYSQIKDSMHQILDELGVSNLERHYDDQEHLLAYRFESKQTTVQLEAALWKKIETIPNLQDLVPGTATDKTLEFSYRPAIITVQFNNVAPSDYRKIGSPLDLIIKQLDVSKLTKSYDPDGYQLAYSFVSSLSPVDLDTVLWDAIAKEESLSAIVQDATSDNTIGYFYLQERPVSKPVSIVLKNLGPDVYDKIGRRFISAIKVIEGIDRLRRAYSEDDQTLRLDFRYQGESIYMIDDAVWEAVKRDSALAALTMAETTDDQLVYVLGGKDTDRREVVIHLRNVSGTDYKIVSTEFASLLRRMKNLRDVSYHYHFKKKTIVFKFRFEGSNLDEFEEALQRAFITHELFKHISKGADTVGRMVYVFSDGARDESAEVDDDSEENQKNSTGVVSNNSNEMSLPDLVAKLDPTVVLILGRSAEGGWHGSGFFVSESGYILTNEHVADSQLVQAGKAELAVKTLDGRVYPVRIIKSDPEQDLALLKVVAPTRQFQSVTIGNSNRVRKGEPVFNIGNPGTASEAYEHSFTVGVVAGLDREYGLMELSMPGRGGQSGSPVFNESGKVIGVVVKVTVDDSGKAFIQVNTPHTDSTGQIVYKTEVVEINVMTRNETITRAIPINHARNLLRLTEP